MEEISCREIWRVYPIRTEGFSLTRTWKLYIQIQRRRFPCNSTEINELHNLECSGAWNQRAISELKRLIAEKCPSLLFICETRNRDINSQLGRMDFGYTCCFVVRSQGKSGGLILFWNDSLNVSIQPYCELASPFLEFTGTTAWYNRVKDFTWLVGGDFNEICFDRENLGGNLRPPSQMQAFRDVLDCCALQDLHFEGDRFTWANRRSNDQIIFERLDR